MKHVFRRQVVCGADLLCRLEAETPSEHRQAGQQHPLGIAEQVVAPLQGGLQALMARRRGAAACGKEPEAVVQARRDLGGGQHTDTGRSKLNGKRHAVQPSADLCHRGGDDRGESEAGIRGYGSVDKESHRLIVGQSIGIPSLPDWRHREWRHGPRGFTGDPKRLAARRQDPQVSAGAEQGLSERDGRADHVFTVVQDQQQPPGAQVADEGLEHRAAGLLTHTNRYSHGRCDQGRVVDRRQPGERGRLAVKLAVGGSHLYR